jgi:molecular chaperone DnaK (HSP70)
MYKKERIPKAVRVAVWNKYNNIKDGISNCYVGCGEQISQNNFECGHVISEKFGGKITIDNLRPICPNCNKSMGSMNMMEFIKKYNFNENYSLNKNPNKILNNSFDKNPNKILTNSLDKNQQIQVNNKYLNTNLVDKHLRTKVDNQPIIIHPANLLHNDQTNRHIKYYCEHCNYKTEYQGTFYNHNKSKKHKRIIAVQKNIQENILEDKITNQNTELLLEKLKNSETINEMLNQTIINLQQDGNKLISNYEKQIKELQEDKNKLQEDKNKLEEIINKLQEQNSSFIEDLKSDARDLKHLTNQKNRYL